MAEPDQREKPGSVSDLAFAVPLAALAIATCWASVRLGLTGSGLFPFCAAAGIAVLTVWAIVRDLAVGLVRLKKNPRHLALPSAHSPSVSAGMVRLTIPIGVALYVYLQPQIGFIASSAVFIVWCAAARLLTRPNLRTVRFRSLGAVLAIAVLLDLLFTYLLKVPVP